MQSSRLYQIVQTFFHYGLDELLPEKALPWYAKIARYSLFWLRNKHKDKTRAQRLNHLAPFL